jgi:hypothetical protein
MFARPEEIARRTAQASFAPGTPIDAGTRAQIDWRVTRDLHTMLGQEAHRSRLYDEAIGDIERMTGTRLRSPYSVMSPRSGAEGLPGVSFEEAEGQFYEQVAKLREEHPELAQRFLDQSGAREHGAEPFWLPHTIPGSPEEMDLKLRLNRQILQDVQARIHERTTSPWVAAAGMGASMAAAVSDPPVLMSMLAGAPWSAGVLRFALTEAGIAAATEVPIQAAIQYQRTKIGEEADLSEAMQNVAMTGAGGLLFGGLLRGAAPMVRGARQLLARSEELPAPRAEVRDAQAYLERLTDVQERNPLAPTGRAAEEHLQRMDAQLVAMREGRVAELGRPEAPVSRAVIREAAQPPSEAVREVVGEPVASVATAIRQVAAQMAGREQSRLATAQALAPLADNAAAAEGLFRALRERPLGVESLLLWLQRSGGVRAADLAPTGIKPTTFAGVVRKQGRSAEEAARAAQEAGFPVSNAEELLDAIRQEMRGQRVVRPEQQGRLTELEALDVLREGLETFGIDARKIATPQDFQGAIAGIGQRAARDSASVSAQRAVDVPEERPLAEMIAEEEQELARLYAGRENERVHLVDENGNSRTITVREMLAEIERDADAFEVLNICMRGGS